MRASVTPLSWHCYVLPVVHKVKFLSWATGWTSGEFQFVLWQRQDTISQSKSVRTCCGTHTHPESRMRVAMPNVPTHLHVVTLKNDGFIHDDNTAPSSIKLLLLLQFPFSTLYSYIWNKEHWKIWGNNQMEWSSVMETKIFCEWHVMRAVCMHSGPVLLQRHLWIHNDSIASQVTWRPASFRYLFGYPLACGLFYVLMSYFSLYLKRSFLSRLLVYLLSFIFSLFAPNCRSISFRSPILYFLYLVITFMCIFLGLSFLLHILFLHFPHILSYHLLQSGQLSEYSDWPAGWTTKEWVFDSRWR